MEALTLLYALTAVLAWGTWLVPSQKVRFGNESIKALYVALPNFALTLLVVFGRGEWGQLARGIAWWPALGGIIWVLSAFCAFVGCKHLGLAKAFGIWAPLNIVVSFIWSVVLFGQFRDASLLLALVAAESVLLIIIGMLLVIFSGSTGRPSQGHDPSKVWIGLAGAFGAGVLWGSYYIPASYLARPSHGNLQDLSAWAAAFPLATGILAGSILFVILGGRSPALEKVSDYGRALLSGVLWTAGNFGMLLLVQEIGPGPGYSLASLCVVVNAIWGMVLFGDPPLRSKAALLMTWGILLAVLAGAVLGNLNALQG